VLERKLIVDRYLKMPARLVLDGQAPQYNDGDFVRVNGSPFTIEESSGILTKKSDISAGAGQKAHRNFVWFPWLPGAISEVQIGATDILTGPMSGCWIFVYRRNNAVVVGHVGTLNNPTDAKTVAVKTAWNNFANDPGTQIIAGFCPTQGQAVAAKGNDGAFLVCALITASQQPDLYMLWLYSQGKAPAFNGQHRIAALTKANPPAPGQNWNIP
jgi:hypothetical protein